MPTRCNRLDFYCKTYCPFNMFRVPLCPSSGAQELYRWLLLVVHGSLVYRSLVWCGAVGFYVSGLRDTAEQYPADRTHQTKELGTTSSNHLYNSWAPDDGHNGARNMLSGKKFAIKIESVASSWHLFSTYYTPNALADNVLWKYEYYFKLFPSCWIL
jgi:hypothetical protein